MYFVKRVKLLAFAFLSLATLSSLALGEDRFALAVGAHDSLIIFGPKGDRVAEITVPTIAQTASTAGASFQISYGRDMDGRLTAILAPTATNSGAMHFNVLGKAVDADQAVVTITFARNLKSVTIDPGYAGTVDVNSHRLRQHRLSDDAPVPGLYAPGQIPQSSVAVVTPSAPVISAPAAVVTPNPAASAQTSAPAVAVASESATPATPASSTPPSLAAPPTLASQMTPSIGGQTFATMASVPAPTRADSADATTSVAAAGYTTKRVKLYWAEPVTPPDGPAPACGVDEVRLVEVYGGVNVTLPGGEIKTGTDGMVIPSGSVVTTLPNSSTAIFMGGVNSARLMPESDVTVTQTFDGMHRMDRIDLDKGAVFGRIGKRAGEVQDFTIHTPEGVSSGDYANLLAFRGTMSDVPSLRTAMNMGRLINPHHLLAWNPPAFGRNLISDVVAPLLGAPTSSGGSTTFYYANNQSLNTSQIKTVVIAAQGTNGQEGPNADDPNRVLQGILTTMLPFNVKLNSLLTQINSGTATRSEITFYKGLISVFFDSQVPAISNNIKGFAGNQTQAGITTARLALLRDLLPFNTPAATPF